MAVLTADNWYGNVMGRFTKVVDSFTAGLRSTTSHTPPASPFGSFGVTAAAGVKPKNTFSRIRETALFTVEEARERISSYIERKFVPETISDLVNYLSDRFLRLETRSQPDGIMANVLVDTKSKKAVPAAQVDPSLSREKILEFQLRSALREQLGRDENSRVADPRDAFSSWEAMKLEMENSSSRARYTVSEGQAWYGIQFAEATGDPAKDARMLAAAKKRGIELVLPRVPGDRSVVPALVPGLPILVKSRSMEAKKIDSRLDHDVLATAFRDNARRAAEARGLDWSDEKYGPSGLVERWLSKGGAAAFAPAAPGIPNKVVSMDAWKFKATHLKKKPDVAVEALGEDHSSSFGGLYEEGAKRDLVLRMDPSAKGGWSVHDRDIGEDVYISVNSLPAGRYPRVTADGQPHGYVMVADDGHVRHFGTNGLPVASSAPEFKAPEHGTPVFGR